VVHQSVFLTQLFRQARACAPSLLFIDEIDSVIGSRSDANCGSSGNSVQQRVLSALLTQMDGVGINSSDLQRHQSKVSSVVEPALVC
jgi:ATP-dependent 26S proteasome regulatory subunit